MKLQRSYVDEIISHAREEAPNECCGIIAGRDGTAVELFRARNAEASPYRYEVDSQDLFRIWRQCETNGWDFLVVYHSHVASEAVPSQTDVRRATWPDAYYIVVSLADPESPSVRAFRIIEGNVSEEQIEVA